MQLYSKSSIKSRSKVILAIFIPIFLAISISVSSPDFAKSMDFALYWQGASMTSQGDYVYDQVLWAQNAIRPGLDTWFHYPFPLAVLLSPLGWLKIETAYAIWIFFTQCALLISVLLLFEFYKDRTHYWELALLIGLAIFRPFYVIALSGQLDGFMLLWMSLAIFLSHKGHWLRSGLLLSLLSLKPSSGLGILAFFSLWLVFQKKWRGLLGIVSGAIILLLIGMIQKPNWTFDYISIGQEVFSYYASIQPTIWGLSKVYFQDTPSSQLIAAIVMFVLIALTSVILSTKHFSTLYAALSLIIPSSLLIAPYAWAYNQILLIIPLIYLATNIALKRGQTRSVLFIYATDAWAILLTICAYWLGYDVWSLLVPVLIILAMLLVTLKTAESRQII